MNEVQLKVAKLYVKLEYCLSYRSHVNMSNSRNVHMKAVSKVINLQSCTELFIRSNNYISTALQLGKCIRMILTSLFLPASAKETGQS